MSSLIELIELLNTCSPWRAGAYMFFITLLLYLIIKAVFDGISNILFIIYGYIRLKKPKKDEDAKQIL
jgi:hypothetical protein|tara:strand:+ start:2628 stop:2831 length:204 start_codon:yes stop_codon:yes gene_type:complete